MQTLKNVVENSDLERLLPGFIDMYRKRVLKANFGGMGFNHSFATYAIARILKPKTIIESGVFRGHSTWLLETACPEAQIYSLDPVLDARTFVSERAVYSTTDFAAYDWSDLDPKETLCFFDDHQSAYARMKDMSWWGFKWAIFEDNFPCGEGDCYSLRHIFAGFGHPHINMSKQYAGNVIKQAVHKHDEFVLNRYYDRQEVLRRPNGVDALLARRNLEYFQEIPPVHRYDTTIWGTTWDGAYTSEAPLVEDVKRNAFAPALTELEQADPGRMFHYNYICVVGLGDKERSSDGASDSAQNDNAKQGVPA